MHMQCIVDTIVMLWCTSNQLSYVQLFAVLKLDNKNSNLPVDEFLKLLKSISEIRHPNIVELVGYCMEFGQRLLIYNYFSNTSLYDILHNDCDLKRKLPWNARIQIALEAAKALG